jgi:hypothetical protein
MYNENIFHRAYIEDNLNIVIISIKHGVEMNVEKFNYRMMEHFKEEEYIIVKSGVMIFESRFEYKGNIKIFIKIKKRKCKKPYLFTNLLGMIMGYL